MKFFIISTFLILLIGSADIAESASQAARDAYTTVASNALYNLGPATTAANQVNNYAGTIFNLPLLNQANVVFGNISTAGQGCQIQINAGLNSPYPQSGANTVIYQLNLMLDILSGFIVNVNAVDATVVPTVQSDITTIQNKINQVKADVQAAQKIFSLALTLSDTTYNTLTTMLQTYISTTNTLVVGWRNGVIP